MIGRVDQRLVFQRHDNRPFFHGETEPCINGRILALGCVFQRTERRAGHATAERAARRRRLELRSAQKPALFVSYHHLRARRSARIRTGPGANRPPSPRPARGPKTICSSATCSARFAPAKSSTNAGCASRSRRFGTTTSCADSIICAMREFNPTAASGKPSKLYRTPPPERSLAAQSASSRTDSIGDGDRRRQRQPLEHAARPPRPALVQPLDRRLTLPRGARWVVCSQDHVARPAHTPVCWGFGAGDAALPDVVALYRPARRHDPGARLLQAGGRDHPIFHLVPVLRGPVPNTRGRRSPASRF